jgi:hypothetical protein
MSGYSYAPASAHDWLAVATAGRLLVAKVSDSTDQVSALAATCDPNISVQQVLEVLTSNGLTATGPFALLFWVDGDLTEQGLGVIVRGEAQVTVDTTNGPVSVSSRGVTTWTEQVIEGATGFNVEVDVDGARSPGLPLAGGAAWVSRISLSTDAASGMQSPVRAKTAQAAASPPPAASAAAAGEADAVASVASAAAPSSPAAPSPATASASDRQQPDGRFEEETRVFHTSTRSGMDAADAPAPESADAAEPEGYDYLFGATVFRPIGAAAGKTRKPEDAAASDPLPVPAFVDPAQQAQPETPGDHDGRTVLASDVSAVRQRARASRPQAQAPDRPPMHSYQLHLPDGTSQALSAPVILGRAPSVSNVPASVLPHLVTLVGDDISRSHVRVAVEGDTVVVTDLHSSNGTHVIAPGKLPQLLRAGEPTPVITGTTIDLGSDVRLHVAEA